MIELIQLLFSLWPAILLAIFLPSSGARLRWWQRFRLRLRPVVVLWGLWSIFGLTLMAAGMPTLGLIPEPANTILFVCLGICASGVYFAPTLLEYARIRRALLTARSVDDLRRLSPEDFEELIAAYFRQYGHQARRLGGSGDHGVDLLIYTKSQEIWIVQCKRWRGSIGEPVVRDLYGAMHHEQAQRAFLMTTGTITPQARIWIKDKPISLYDGEGLVRLLKRLRNKKAIKHPLTRSDHA